MLKQLQKVVKHVLENVLLFLITVSKLLSKLTEILIIFK